jgi:hypothetical protein
MADIIAQIEQQVATNQTRGQDEIAKLKAEIAAHPG